MNYICGYNGTRTHNHLVYKRIPNHLTKLALGVNLRTKWLWVRVPLHVLKFQISRLFRARSSSKTSTWHDENIQSMNYLWWQYEQSVLVRAKKIQMSYLSCHWRVMQNLNKPWPCGFKNGMKNWVNSHWSTQKSENCTLTGSFCPYTAYTVSVRKFQSNYVSWH